MKENKIPTAEEFIMIKVGTRSTWVKELVIEFAKLHVKAALEAAALNAEIKEDVHYLFARQLVNIDSILCAYPEELIK